MHEATTLTTENRETGVTLIRINGDLDSMGTHMVENAFNTALTNRKTNVVVDLGHVSFISSAGMAMMLIRGKLLRQGGGSMTIAAPNARVLEVLSLAGFQELFEVYPTVAEALAIVETR
jgi:anti-anti-sigma factor